MITINKGKVEASGTYHTLVAELVMGVQAISENTDTPYQEVLSSIHGAIKAGILMKAGMTAKEAREIIDFNNEY